MKKGVIMVQSWKSGMGIPFLLTVFLGHESFMLRAFPDFCSTGNGSNKFCPFPLGMESTFLSVGKQHGCCLGERKQPLPAQAKAQYLQSAGLAVLLSSRKEHFRYITKYSLGLSLL